MKESIRGKESLRSSPLRSIFFAATLASGLISDSSMSMAQERDASTTRRTPIHREGVVEDPHMDTLVARRILSEVIECDTEKDERVKMRSCLTQFVLQNTALHSLYNAAKTDSERKGLLIKINRQYIEMGRIIEAYERRFNTEDWIAANWSSPGIYVDPPVKDLLTRMKKAQNENAQERLLDEFVRSVPDSEADTRGSIQGFMCGRFGICKIN